MAELAVMVRSPTISLALLNFASRADPLHVYIQVLLVLDRLPREFPVVHEKDPKRWSNPLLELPERTTLFRAFLANMGDPAKSVILK